MRSWGYDKPVLVGGATWTKADCDDEPVGDATSRIEDENKRLLHPTNMRPRHHTS